MKIFLQFGKDVYVCEIGIQPANKTFYGTRRL